MSDAAKPEENGTNREKTDGFEPARAAILHRALALAPFEGWTALTLQRAANAARIDAATAKAAFPRGVGDLLRFWAAQSDAAMLDAMAAPEFKGLRIRDKVAFAVEARLAAIRPHKEAARRAAAMLALPPLGFLGAELVWKTADAIWRGLKDASTDFNFYSKRAILAGVWSSTFARWLADDSEGEEATRVFLKARIENVMQFEKAKARVRELGLDPAKPIEWLARLRYPGGRAPTPARVDRETKIDQALDQSFPASDPPYWSGGL